jgi:hypothetical protein
VVTGGIGVSGTVYAGAFNGNLTGTLQTAAQANITSVGNLTSLTVDTNTLVVDAVNDRVGIGITNPAGKLSVIGGGVAGVTTYLGGTVDDGLMLGYVPSIGLAEIIGVNHAFSTYNDIGLRAGNNTQLYLSTNGKVGINVAPAAGTDAKLQVTGGTTNVSSLLTAYSTAAVVVVPKSSSGYSLAIASGPGDLPQIQVSANGAASGNLLIQPYGSNVGIGTTNPTETLHVSGTNIRIDGTSGEAGVYMYRGNGNAPDVRFYTSNGSIASPTATANGGLTGQIHWHGHDGTGYQDRAGIYGTVDGAVSTGTVPIALRFLTGTAGLGETMRITSAGNVNIGSSGDPNAKFQVELVGTVSLVSANITKSTDFANSARAGFPGLTNNSDGIYFGMGANGTGIPAGFGFFREASGWNTALTFYTNNVTSGPNSTSAMQEKMRITSAGNVGINNSGPGAKLHITATSADESIFKIAGSGSTNATVKFADVDIGGQGYGGSYLAWGRGGSYDNWFMVYTRTGGNVSAERLRITSDGSVGINNSNPTYKLDIGVNSGQTTTSGAGGNIRNSTAADTAPYTQARITIYGDTNVDTGNWAYLAYGSDAVARFVYAKTGSAPGQLSFGTSSATNGTGTYTEMMRMNNNGVMTLTNQPAFYAVGAGGSTAYGNGGEFILTSVQTNRGSNYSSSTGRFTAPVAGFYSFTYAIYSYAGAAQQISFKKNGSDWVVGDTSGLNTVVPNYIGGTAFMLYLAANDTASFGWRNGYSGNIYHGHTWFSGHLVG